MFDLRPDELRQLSTLRRPERIQDYLDSLAMNFELRGETCKSPRRVLTTGSAHCMEGAMLAALALRLQGEPPLVMDLKSRRGDDDHVVALFRRHGCFGAISKTNHGVLRYRDPVYRTLRELALSYFHEYFTDDGAKTLRSFSVPMDLSRFDHLGWATSPRDLWVIPRTLDRSRHLALLDAAQVQGLRRADPMERLVTSPQEWNVRGKRRTEGLAAKRRS